ncbi:universal stress protein [Bailinhaonella thermotolerans]|uniref:Universal stress protein n=1 Tax=Bailinhaonella thermotolerans TaxID=1070861 RepID=A0A3A4BAY8_9ACTN|nr:universal stress protein [Bailinhaonella thermotolerans]RJL31368.1 universal stress protein [Bailinhaonella thermotolerans]
MKFDHVLVGYVPDRRGRDALALAALIARTAGAALSVAHVNPAAWDTPSPGRVDAEWRSYLRERAKSALEEAAGLLSDAELPHPPDLVVHAHRGSGRGLSEVVSKVGADLVVIGSAPGRSAGHITVGSTADQLLHGSRVPVALAPKGYGERPPRELERLSVAYRREPEADDAVALAARAAGRYDVPLRLLTLMVRRAGATRIEGEMLDLAHEQLEADLAASAKESRRRATVTTEVLEGPNVAKALAGTEWLRGEMLVCASSASGPIRKVFMGDMSLKILRAATIPVMVLPRAAVRTR